MNSTSKSVKLLELINIQVASANGNLFSIIQTRIVLDGFVSSSSIDMTGQIVSI